MTVCSSTDDNVEPGIAKIEGMGATLVAEPQNCDFRTLQQFGIKIGLRKESGHDESMTKEPMGWGLLRIVLVTLRRIGRALWHTATFNTF